MFEPKRSSELDEIMVRYKKSAQSKKGAALFAVCRGKISEGIDLAISLPEPYF